MTKKSHGSEGDDWGWRWQENTPTASFVTKIGKMQTAGCRLCRIAREARGESTDGLTDETHGHINSAGCEGMATTVTGVHHSIWRHLYDSMHAAQKPKSNQLIQCFLILDLSNFPDRSLGFLQWEKEKYSGTAN